MGQHAGSGALRLVFSVLGGVQGKCAKRILNWVWVQRLAHRPLAQTLLQCHGQGLCLKSLQQHQQLRRCRIDVIGRIGGTGGPCQRNARYRGLQCECRRVHARGHLATQARSPLVALGRGNRSSDPGQTPGGFHQTPGQHGLLFNQPGSGQQVGSGQHVARRVELQVVWPGRKTAQTSGPVHGGFKPG